eukprot:2154640-Rhodomonas_salina.1
MCKPLVSAKRSSLIRGSHEDWDASTNASRAPQSMDPPSVHPNQLPCRHGAGTEQTRQAPSLHRPPEVARPPHAPCNVRH